jgi:hypothetical protein
LVRTYGAVVLCAVLLPLMVGCPTTPPGPGDSQDGNGNGDQNGNGAAERTFVGTDTCLTCHGATKGNFPLTGHPFKLNAVENGQPPEYPVTELAGPPPGVEWTDVAFVIGGYRYKYRVVDNDGFIVLGPTAQYNFPSQGRSAYSNDDAHTAPDGTPGPWDENIGRKPYNCGKCHTTGYDAEAENHHGLEGLVGDWAFEGVHCEACHGAGSDHVAAATSEERHEAINGHPDTETVCGRCHTRNPDGIEAKGGFVRHHEQWDEFSRSVHATAPGFDDGCMTCHDVHEPLFDADRLAAIQVAFVVGDMNPMAGLGSPPGIIKECSDCHTNVTVAHVGPDECKACHMAFTDKSAVAINDNAGDIRSHIWDIEVDPDAKMFTDVDGNPVDRDDTNVKFAALDEDGEAFITLDFACLQCHTDKDINWAAGRAESIHGQ